MSKTVEFLRDAGTFYIATCEGDQPRVRPFGAVVDYDGRVYFCTNNRKNVFAQMVADPKVEICACKPDGAWIRIAGEAVIDSNDAVKQAMLDAMPSLRRLYHVGDGLFEVFYLQNATATINTFGQEPETFAL